MNFDVVACGELLIDFSPENARTFQQNPGGAPANVLVALSRLGRTTSFIGKVGQDHFGLFLKETLMEQKVDTTGLVLSKDTNTTLAFVHLDDKGDRSFTFYRDPGADKMLTAEEVNHDLIAQAKIFHFGSVSMTHDPARTATQKAVQYAKAQGKWISFDPNLRPALWNSLDEAKEVILDAIANADILKVSVEELIFLTGCKTLQEGTKKIYEAYSPTFIFVTLGAEGCFYRMNNRIGLIKGFEVQTVDTTGAGDAFLAGIVEQLLARNKDFSLYTSQDLEDMVRFANAMGALATTRKGAIPSMPTREEIEALLLIGD